MRFYCLGIIYFRLSWFLSWQCTTVYYYFLIIICKLLYPTLAIQHFDIFIFLLSAKQHFDICIFLLSLYEHFDICIILFSTDCKFCVCVCAYTFLNHRFEIISVLFLVLYKCNSIFDLMPGTIKDVNIVAKLCLQQIHVWHYNILAQ